MENIYDFIIKEKNDYAKKIDLEEGWKWSMKAHLRHSFLIKNSQFLEENENRYLRPNKNIVLAIANIAYRSEGFDVKDIELYVNNVDTNYKSLIVRKYHEKWAVENAVDTLIDDIVVSYHDYGGVLVRNTDKRPEIIDLRALAFCNQTDLLAYPFAILHKMSPSDLRKMKKWGKKENGATIDLEALITITKKEAKKEIEVLEVHGLMPTEWLTQDDSEPYAKDTQQIQIVAFYKKENGNAQGVTLFRHEEPKLPFKFLARDKVEDRALGRSGIEELFEEQTWTNWNEIKITEMLEAASKQINLSDDKQITSKHPSGLKDMENHEIIDVTEGKKGLWQMDVSARDISAFNNALDRWNTHAQILGSASEGMLGVSPSSGTPFRLYEAQNILAQGMHKYRQGQISVFMDEIYRDWLLKHVQNDINNDQEFLSELSADEMQFVAKRFAIKEWNKMVKGKVLGGGTVEEDKEAFIQFKINDYLGEGNKRFIKIVKKEFADEPLNVRTNIAGKQKDLALLTDKMTGVLREVVANPQIRQDPEMMKWLNVMLENSGLAPIMFAQVPQLAQANKPGMIENIPTKKEPLEQ